MLLNTLDLAARIDREIKRSINMHHIFGVTYNNFQSQKNFTQKKTHQKEPLYGLETLCP